MEKFIQTLREMLAKATWALDQLNWPQFLFSLITNYNKTYHHTIQAKSEAIFKQKVLLEQVLTHVIPDLVVGDRVRLVLKQKNQFTKGETTRLSKKTYLLRKKVGLRWVIMEHHIYIYIYIGNYSSSKQTQLF